MSDKPVVLFLCTHNAGRSLAARVLLDYYANGTIDVRSAGSEPANQLNPSVVAVLQERGLDATGEHPKLLTADDGLAADVIVTMGCGDTCPVYPGKRYVDCGPSPTPPDSPSRRSGPSSTTSTGESKLYSTNLPVPTHHDGTVTASATEIQVRALEPRRLAPSRRRHLRGRDRHGQRHLRDRPTVLERLGLQPPTRPPLRRHRPRPGRRLVGRQWHLGPLLLRRGGRAQRLRPHRPPGSRHRTNPAHRPHRRRRGGRDLDHSDWHLPREHRQHCPPPRLRLSHCRPA